VHEACNKLRETERRGHLFPNYGTSSVASPRSNKNARACNRREYPNYGKAVLPLHAATRLLAPAIGENIQTTAQAVLPLHAATRMQVPATGRNIQTTAQAVLPLHAAGDDCQCPHSRQAQFYLRSYLLAVTKLCKCKFLHGFSSFTEYKSTEATTEKILFIVLDYPSVFN
jgi:hypothetical protein